MQRDNEVEWSRNTPKWLQSVSAEDWRCGFPNMMLRRLSVYLGSSDAEADCSIPSDPIFAEKTTKPQLTT